MKFITHPNNVKIIKQQIEKDYKSPDDDFLGLHRPRPDFLFGISIIADKDISQTGMFPTGRFQRDVSHRLEDNKFCEWVTEEDLKQGTRWMRDIGLIVDILEERPLYYMVRSGTTIKDGEVRQL